MKLVLILCSLAGVICAQQEVGAIDWTGVQPIWQSPGFLDNFPILRWIISRDRGCCNGFISGGFLAETELFPWNVALLFHLPLKSGLCAGTLMNNEWVMTAAHCAQLSSSGVAIMGNRNIRNHEDPTQQRIVFSRSTIHPQWDPSSFRNDLALVRLDSPVQFSPTIQPARLPTFRQMGTNFVNQRATVSGWGSFESSVAPDLRFIRTQVMAGRLSCSIHFPGLVHAENICTSGALGNSPCEGDSGAAIMVTEVDFNKTVIGVLSFGSALGCQFGRPAVYTLVGPHLQWISSASGITIRPT